MSIVPPFNLECNVFRTLVFLRIILSYSPFTIALYLPITQKLTDYMKRAINLLLACLLASSGQLQAAFYDFLNNAEFRGTLSLESETVYRGSKIAQVSLNPNLEAAIPFYCYRAYGGMWAILPFNNSQVDNARQVNPFVGLSWDVTDLFALDTGYIFYWFNHTKGTDPFPFINDYTNRQHEVYGGITADVILSPAFYLFYNTTLAQWFFEPSIAHCFPLEEFGAKNFSIDVGAHLGWLHASKFNGDQRPAGIPSHKNGYVYWGTKVDLTYKIDETFSVSIGARYTGNNDSNSIPSAAAFTANALGSHEHLFWWGIRTTFAY